MAGRSLKYFRNCSLPFLLSPLLICWGLSVLSISLVTLALTSSYGGVFPFGAPLWTGILFLATGCFLVFVYKASENLALTSKAHVWFTLTLGIMTTCESLLALALSLWHYLTLSPILSLCSPDPSFGGGGPGMTCECTEGFINQPSLMRLAYRFEGVSDCAEFGSSLRVFYNILTGLYTLGVVLALSLFFGGCKKLHTLAVCGESGVYTITPATSLRTSRQGTPDVTTGVVPAVTGHSNLSATGHSTTVIVPSHRFTGTPSYLMSRRRTAVVTATTTGGRNRLTSTGSTYQSAMI